MLKISIAIYQGKTGLIHDYHQTKVTDHAAYGKAFGKAMFLLSTALLLSGIIGLFGASEAAAKLAVELDGSQHYEEINIKKDTERTAFLESYGLTVIRIPNNEVNRNFRGVCDYIDAAVRQSLSQLR